MRLDDSHEGDVCPQSNGREKRAQRRRERRARAAASPPPPPIGESVQVIVEELHKAAGHIKVLGAVQADRAKLKAAHYVSRVSVHALVWLITATLLVSGTVLVCRGMARFLDALFDNRPGIADLAWGGALLIGLTAWLLMRSKLRHKRELEIYRDKYARIEREASRRAIDQDGDAPAHAGGAARP